MDAAASMIEKAIIANPTYSEAYNNLGVLKCLIMHTLPLYDPSSLCATFSCNLIFTNTLDSAELY